MIFKRLLQADGKEVSRTAKTVALVIANSVNTLLSILLSMAAARVLSKTEVAINSQTFLAYSTFSPFLTLGIDSGIYYYLAHNEHRKRTALNECMLLVFVSSLLFAMFIFFGGNDFLARVFKSPTIARTLYYMIPYVLIITPTSVLTSVFVYENRLRFNAVFSTMQTFVTLLITLIAMLWFHTGQSMVIARVLTSCAFSLIMICSAYSILPRNREKFSWKNTRHLLSVSLPLALSNLVGTMDRHLDQWIISTMLTPESFAVYTRGAQELPLIGTITGSINTVIVADLTRAVKEKDYATAVRLFQSMAAKSSLLLMPAMVFFMAAAKPLISFLYTEAYLEAVPVFQIYLLYLPIRVTAYGPFLIALGHSRFILYKTTVELVLNAGLSVLLVTLLGAEGAALGSILLLYVFNVPLNLYIISKDTGISWKQLLPFRKMLLYILWSLPGVAVFRVVETLLPLPPFWTLVLDFVIFCGVSGPVFLHALHLSPRALFRRCYRIVRSLFSGGRK